MRPLFVLVLLSFLPISLRPAFAQSSGSSSSKTRKAEQHVTRHSSASAETAETIYRNAEFAFTYKIPYAWVDRTQPMQDNTSDPQKSKLLLAVFERPPEVTGDTVNSAVVITAESAGSYPGLKNAADYIGPLTELTISKGFTAAGDPSEFTVGSTTTVRVDFTKEIGNLTMRQSCLIVLRKRWVLSFTFIGGSEDEVEELLEKLSFSAGKP
jgi:hypothetical protein